MLIRFFIFSIVVLCSSPFVTAQNTQDYYLNKAQTAFDDDNFEEAVKYFKKVADRDPSDLESKYQLAFAYYWAKKYTKAIKMGLDLIEKNPKEPKYYRLTANAYDLEGNYKDAVKVLEMGIRNLPYDGVLYFDLGVIEHIKGKMPEALHHWERGIKSAPYYAENYYWAAKTYANSDEKIWAIMYAEMFLNLEKGTERFNEISSLLLDSYRNLLREIPNINLGDEAIKTMSQPERINHAYDWFIQALQKKGTISLSEIPDSILKIKTENLDQDNMVVSNEVIVLKNKSAQLQLSRTERNRFEEAYLFVLTMLRENGMLNLPSAGRISNGDYHFLKAVSSIRTDFVELWMQVFHEELPIPLFVWQFELQDKKIFDAYNHWLMSNGDPNYFIQWQQEDNTQFQVFLDRLISKPLKVDIENYFVRTDYIIE